jgi:hypothetical protein
MAVWTYAEAAPVVEAIDAAVRPHGFRAQMVGSVATYGSSDKDVDVTVIAEGTTSPKELLAVVGAIERLYRLRDVNADVLGFQDEADRTIEVWLCNIPHGVLYDNEFDQGVGQFVTLSERQLALLREIEAEPV